MHVLYVMGQNAGGLPHYTVELANEVANHAEVTVMKPSETTADGLFADETAVRNAFSPLELSMPKLYRRDIDPLDVVRGIRSYDSLEEIRETDADIVHDTTDLFPHVKLFMKRHRIDEFRPLVVTRHEVEMTRFTPARPHHLAEELVDYVLPDLRLDRVIVHTENQRRALVQRGVSPEDVEVIPHGAYSIFGGHEDVETEPEENCLLFFGNVVPHKGVDTLVRSIPLIKREIPDVRLIIAGDGRIPPEVEPIIERHSRNFELHNRFVPNEEVRELFARAQLVVMPYRERKGRTNGHSGALATAISFGKPVVTSCAGDFPSLVRSTGCGSVVPSGDPERLAGAITQLLQDDDARRESAANSRQLAEELSWENIARKHVDLYEDVLRKTPATAAGQ